MCVCACKCMCVRACACMGPDGPVPMSKQTKVLPAPGAESSTEKPPTLHSRSPEASPSPRRRPSEPRPSLHGRPSERAPSLRSRALDEAPALPSRPLKPAPSLMVPSPEPRPSVQPPSSKKNSSEPGASSAPGLHPAGPRKKVVHVTNWFFATIGLLFICAILFPLVSIMNSKVTGQSRTMVEHIKMFQLQILILSEILHQVQIGKVPTCGMCRIQWLQHRDNCYLFRRTEMSWPSSMGFCKDKLSSLPTLNSTEEMDFLRHESKRYFDPYQKMPKFWIGLKYEPSMGKWLRIDGSVLNIKHLGVTTHRGCIFLQNGRFYSQPCSEHANIVCKAKVQLG
ncbi:hypothetical protein JRQ81_015476 [Phrynocephalus forsythii]|uniref:C-type lectin domain-containing protein n=1 Tax=Phrynocephalus forsythii TaxID=171643 RepID=A0A9Q0XU44_9SAUR|nr:hypothetical protein JRQ81_015476 [Phrynocephalus forsythii]